MRVTYNSPAIGMVPTRLVDGMYVAYRMQTIENLKNADFKCSATYNSATMTSNTMTPLLLGLWTC